MESKDKKGLKMKASKIKEQCYVCGNDIETTHILIGNKKLCGKVCVKRLEMHNQKYAC